jgi:hypothetical protein
MPKKHRVKRMKQNERTRKMDEERRAHIAKQQEKGRLRNRGEAAKRERPENFSGPNDDEENTGFMDDDQVDQKVTAPAAAPTAAQNKQTGGRKSKAASSTASAPAIPTPSKSDEARSSIKAKFAAAASIGEQTRSNAPGKARRVEDD